MPVGVPREMKEGIETSTMPSRQDRPVGSGKSGAAGSNLRNRVKEPWPHRPSPSASPMARVCSFDRIHGKNANRVGHFAMTRRNLNLDSSIPVFGRTGLTSARSQSLKKLAPDEGRNHRQPNTRRRLSGLDDRPYETRGGPRSSGSRPSFRARRHCFLIGHGGPSPSQQQRQQVFDQFLVGCEKFGATAPSTAR